MLDTCPNWHDGSRLHAGPHGDAGSPLVAAFRLTAIVAPGEASYRGRGDTEPVHALRLAPLELMEPHSAGSNLQPVWLAMLAQRRQQGWDFIFSDDSGLRGHAYAAYAAHCTSSEMVIMIGGYLGPTALLADAEMSQHWKPAVWKT